MAKQEAFGARLDLKQFFEASVGALQNMNGSGRPPIRQFGTIVHSLKEPERM